MSVSIFWNSNRWLTKFKKNKCEDFYRIKQPFKFLKIFLNIMVRIHLNNLLQVLDKVYVSHHEYNFITLLAGVWPNSRALLWDQC